MLSLLYQFPTCLQRLFGGVVWRGKETDDEGRKTVYLTFDDGPIPEVTPRLLELLEELDVKATFFMVGDNIRKHPDIYRSVLAHGHAVGNHTYHHARGWHLSTEEYINEVREWEQETKDSKDLKVAKVNALFRPPHGQLTRGEERWLHQQGYRIYMWDVLTHDYNEHYSAECMVRIVQRYTRPGSIINWHDSLRSNERMLTAVRQSVIWLKSQGYSFSLL